MTERLMPQVVSATLLALLSVLFVAVANAGEVLRFENAAIATEQQILDDVLRIHAIPKEQNIIDEIRTTKEALKIDSKSVQLFVVQFNQPIQLTDRQNLETLKAEVLSYVPDDALIIRATPKIAQTIRLSSDTVRVVLPYEPEWKLSSALPLPSVLTQDQLIDAQVKFASEKDASSSLKSVRNLKDTEIVSSEADRMFLRTSPINLEPISEIKTVEWIAAASEVPAQTEPSETAAGVRDYLIVQRQLEAPSDSLLQAAEIHGAKDESSLSQALIVDETSGVATGEQHVYPISVNNFGKLVVTLVYNDAEISPITLAPIANDLDLVVVDSFGRETAIADKTRTFEHFEHATEVGSYEIRVKGTNIPAGKQPYALMVSVR